MPSSPKKLSFKKFACEHRSKLCERYPFLTHQQIQAKLKKIWKKVCQEHKEFAKSNRSPKKSLEMNEKTGYFSSLNSTCEDKGSSTVAKQPHNITGSPRENVCKDSQSSASPVSDMDSGSWYDDVSIDSSNSAQTTDEKLEINSPRKKKENFTEETFKDVLQYTLNIESQKSCSERDSNSTKTDKTVSGLFSLSSASLQNKELLMVQSSRLLSSEENKGKSNFDIMFDDNKEIFF